MATRNAPTLKDMADMPTTATEVLDVLKAHQGPKPLTLKALMDETGETAVVLLELLDVMEETDKTITTDGRGLSLTIKATGAAPKPTKKVAAKKSPAKPAAPAVTLSEPVVEAPAPAPVVVEEKQEETPAEVPLVVEDAPKDERQSLVAMVDALTMRRDAASNVREGYTPPEEITTLPPRPYGVSVNFWDMAHNAYSVSERDTLTAQLYWMRKALQQHNDAI